MKTGRKTEEFTARMLFILIHAGLILLLAVYAVMLFADASSWLSGWSIVKALFSTYNPLSYTILTGAGAKIAWLVILLYGALSLLTTYVLTPETEHSFLRRSGGFTAVLTAGLILLFLFFFSDSRGFIQTCSLGGLISVLFSYAAFFRSSPERTRAASDFIISIFFALFLFFTLNVYAGRTNIIMDVSSSQFYSLSEPTIKMIDSLERKIKIYVILQASPIRKGLIYDYTKKLLSQVENRTDQITVEYIPPRSGKAETLIRKYNIRSDEAVIFESGEKSKAIPVDPSGNPLAVFAAEETHHPGMDRSIREIEAYKGEYIFFLTINEITSERKKELLFIEGHGERSVTGFEADSLTELSEELTKLNYTVLTKRLKQGEIPVADALVIAGPTVSFLDWEVEAIRRYLKETNGSLIYFAEPIIRDSWVEEAGLAPLLEEYGIKLHNAAVIWYSKKYRGYFDDLKTDSYEIHPITAPFTNEEVYFKTSRPVSEGSTVEPTMKSSLLVLKAPSTDQDMWGETRVGRSVRTIAKDEKDIRPPIGLAAVSGPKKVGNKYFETPRIIVLGDVDIATNRYFRKLNNSNFLINCFNWTLEQEQVEKIPPKNFEFIKIDVSDNVMSGVFNLIVVGIPGFFLLFGIIVLIRRKS